MRIGTTELILILVVVLVIFGPMNLPKLGKMFGQSMKGFKEGLEDEETGETKKSEPKSSDKSDEE